MNNPNERITKLYCRFVTGMTVDLQIREETKTVKQLKA